MVYCQNTFQEFQSDLAECLTKDGQVSKHSTEFTQQRKNALKFFVVQDGFPLAMDPWDMDQGMPLSKS